MPGFPTPRRRSRDEFESDEETEASYELGTPEAEDSARKKQRLSNGTTITSPSESSSRGANQEQDGGMRNNIIRPRAPPRKHQPGSIVRVKLAHFVTYTAVEFFPGPSLNMVIGPNGTGKSTLVCAICLGLGWPTSTLGRAKEVGEYVKHGAKEAKIEIELAKDGKDFKENLVVRCTIKKDGNKSAFSLNGQSKSKKQVVEIVKKLSIQIDNLCQFLPQDRVVEFAAMTPIELLKSTEQAVASTEMIKAHEDLKVLRVQQKALQTKAEQDQETLSNLESRQRLQEGDVERMRQREEVVNKVKMLEKSRPSVIYQNAVKKTKELGVIKRANLQEFKALEEEVEPVLADMKSKQSYQNKVEAVVRQRRDALVGAERSADSIDRGFNELQTQSTAVDVNVEKLKQKHKERRQQQLKEEGKLRELKIQQQNPPPDVDAAAANELMRAEQRKGDEAQRIIRQRQSQQRELAEKGRINKGQINDAKEGLRQLDSSAGQQSAKLQRMSRDTAQMWKWIQENPNAFEKPVFGPPITECSVKDPKFCDQIESLFQRGQMLSFTVQSKADFKTLSNISHDRLKLSEIHTRQVTQNLESFRSAATSEEQMRQYGFDGSALDYLNGPEPVLAMLCGEIKLHETGVVSKDITSQQFETLEKSNISNWVTNKSTYRVSRRREYGAANTLVKPIKKAQIWTDQPIDQSTKQPILDKIHDLTDEIEGWQGELAEAQAIILRQRQVVDETKEEHKRLQEEKSEQQKALGNFRALPSKISNSEAKIEAIKNELQDHQTQVTEQLAKKDTLAMDRANRALEYADAIEVLRTRHNDLHEVELMLIEASSDAATLVSRNQEVKDLLSAKKNEAAETERAWAAARAEGTAAMADLKPLLAIDKTTPGEPLKAFMQIVSHLSIEDFNSEVQSERARLDLMAEGSSNMIDQYEDRARKIGELSKLVDDAKFALNEVGGHITELKSDWEPQLDALIEKISESFSHNMSQIHCAGEVGIHKDEDFEAWAIEIRVKFRENEPLTLLTSHRQSGGERAVSTIFYLMSLQSLTSSPFRVVDEINQGMDPRNERLVHKRMVDIACDTGGILANDHDSSSAAEDEEEERGGVVGRRKAGGKGGGSQYFLITPKLLHDLTYAPGMRVMCIASGEYMPGLEGETADDAGGGDVQVPEKVDFGRYVNIRRGIGPPGGMVDRRRAVAAA